MTEPHKKGTFGISKAKSRYVQVTQSYPLSKHPCILSTESVFSIHSRMSLFLCIMLWRLTIGVNSVYLFKGSVLCAHCKIYQEGAFHRITGATIQSYLLFSLVEHQHTEAHTGLTVKRSKSSLALHFTLVQFASVGPQQRMK